MGKQTLPKSDSTSGMLMFDIYPKNPSGAYRPIARVSDAELATAPPGTFDLRIYDIKVVRTNEDRPRSVIEVMVKGKKKDKYEKVYFPIFVDADLDRIYISASGHFTLKSSLSPQQLLWMETTNAGFKLLLAD